MPGSAQTMLQAHACTHRSKWTLLGVSVFTQLCFYGLVKLCGYCRFKHNLLLISLTQCMPGTRESGSPACKRCISLLGWVSEEEKERTTVVTSVAVWARAQQSVTHPGGWPEVLTPSDTAGCEETKAPLPQGTPGNSCCIWGAAFLFLELS